MLSIIDFKLTGSGDNDCIFRRANSIQTPSGFIWSLEFDGRNLQAIVDPSHNRTTYSYDARSWIDKVTDPVGREPSTL